ncbi:MAG: hemolysin family protein [Sphingomonadales bacterium]
MTIQNSDNKELTERQDGFVGAIKSFFKSILFSSKGETSLRESLEGVIEEHEEEDGAEDWSEDEQSMLINVLNYGDLRIDDIMVPRVDIVAVNSELSFDELVEIFADAAHSRLPIHSGSLDEILGMIHIKDLVKYFVSSLKKGNWKINNLIRPVLFVAPSMRPMDLLEKMRAGRTHMAIVVDEYGGTDGLITIEDLIEQIVGDIEDEYDAEENVSLIKIRPNVFEANARLEIADLEDTFGVDFLLDKQDEDLETLGGLVVSIEGRVPQIGEFIIHPLGHKFEILDADPRKIKKVRIHLPSSQSEEK